MYGIHLGGQKLMQTFQDSRQRKYVGLADLKSFYDSGAHIPTEGFLSAWKQNPKQ